MSDMNHEQLERHNLESRPLKDTTAALGREAETPSDHLDPTTARNQRIMLMNIAQTQQTNGLQQGDVKTSSRRMWPMWLGGAVALVACVVLAVVRLQPSSKVFAPLTSSDVTLSQLLIPEAHAGDAFTLVSTSQDAAGVATDTAFTLTSAVAASVDQLNQNLRVVPAVPLDITSNQANEFHIQPKAALTPGSVYRFTLATAVQTASGTRAPREFSWAIQTKDTFRVLSSVPGNASSYVPIDTGIEITLSQTGWEDPKPFFSISPPVDGHFEAHGRSLAFVPNAPLKAGQLYRVIYKQGWKLQQSDLSLKEDHVIRFETAPTQPEKEIVPDIQINPRNIYYEAAVQHEAFMPVSLTSCRPLTSSTIQITGYSLSHDETRQMIQGNEHIPGWARAERERSNVFLGVATRTSAFELATQLVGDPTLCRQELRIPGLPAGMYAVRITPQVASSIPQWFLLQVTNVATYTIVDEQKTVIWAMSMDSRQPLSHLPLHINGQLIGATDDQGVATFPTPGVLTSTSTDENVAMIEVGDQGFGALVPLTKNGFNWSYIYRIRTTDDKGQTQALLFPDRPLYHPSDSLSFFGFGQDRDTHRASVGLTVVLRRNSFVDFTSYDAKSYASATVQPDNSGFFQGTLNWDTLAPGTYELVLQRDGHDVLTRAIEIRDFIKPAYTIEVVPTKTSVYAGESIDGQTKVALFDGTPLAKQTLMMEYAGSDGITHPFQVITNEDGIADFHVSTTKQTCNLETPRYVYCSEMWVQSISARPLDAEEAQLQASAYVRVWAARASLDVQASTKGDQATFAFRVRRVELNQVDDQNQHQVLTDPIPGAHIRGRIVEQRWVQVQQGVAYDYVEKKVVPRYRYDLQEKDLKTIDLVSNSQGYVSSTFPMGDNVSYRMVATIQDERGSQSVATSEVAKGWYARDTGSEAITLQPTTPRDDRPSYKLNEPVSVSFFKGGQRFSDTQADYLYVEASRGIQKTTRSKQATYEFNYRNELVPNMILYGIRFDEHGFTEATYYASFDTSDRALNVRITPDKAAYAPGERVNATIEAQTLDRVPLAGVRLAVSSVDRALLAAYGGDRSEYPLQELYGDVPTGILLTRASHDSGFNRFDYGADGMGGGGADAPRRNFKDTADFQVLITDQNGHATMSFTAPDNMTSWNMYAMAVTSDAKAGTASTDITVTKPVFVDAVIPATLLATDAPIIKLRAFGAALKNTEPVQYTVEAPSLGIMSQQVTGTAAVPVYVALDHLTPGDHVMTIRLQTSHGGDALERHVRVLSSRMTMDELVKTELGPGSALPDAGTGAETQVTFVSLNRARFIPLLHSLANPWSARAESQLASVVARQLLRGSYQQQDIPVPESVLAYQGLNGGISSLPYASEEVELSSKVAAVAPDAFDRGRLTNYLWTIADKKDVSREEAIRALSGLAALGQPVLIRLKSFGTLNDLGWRERLALARGLEAAGDREGARGFLNTLLDTSETRDGLIHLTVDTNPRFILEATAEAAALAAGVADPRADGLNAYVETNWSNDALNDLDRISYVQRLLPTLTAEDASLIYVAGQAEQRLEFHDGQSQTRLFTTQEMKQFRAIAVQGPLVAVFTRRVPKKPTVVPEVHLTRSFRLSSPTSTPWTEGDTITVTLTPTWDKQAQDGCYVVRDRVPSGLAPVQTIGFDIWPEAGHSYPVSLENNEISFITCKGYSNPAIIYQTRVVSRGTYKAEPASLQSMDAPSVTALSEEATIAIR